MAAILNLRLKGTADEIETLVARISALPGVELSAPDLKPARYGTGFLGYFTAVVHDAPEGTGHEGQDHDHRQRR